ncbi:hypothetical protein ACWEQ8_43355, partial [Streptomyces noursei]
MNLVGEGDGGVVPPGDLDGAHGGDRLQAVAAASIAAGCQPVSSFGSMVRCTTAASRSRELV